MLHLKRITTSKSSQEFLLNTSLTTVPENDTLTAGDSISHLKGAQVFISTSLKNKNKKNLIKYVCAQAGDLLHLLSTAMESAKRTNVKRFI